MKYALLIYANEAEEQQLPEHEWQALIEQHNNFAERYADSVLAGEALEPTRAAQSLRRTGTTVAVHDGPFAETKEQLGGFYLIEAADMQQAIAMARELPLAEGSVIEVRPVMGL